MSVKDFYYDLMRSTIETGHLLNFCLERKYSPDDVSKGDFVVCDVGKFYEGPPKKSWDLGRSIDDSERLLIDGGSNPEPVRNKYWAKLEAQERCEISADIMQKAANQPIKVSCVPQIDWPNNSVLMTMKYRYSGP